jgi:hypothetical protein
MDHDDDTSWRQGYVTWPEGIFDRVHPRDRPVDLDRAVAVGQEWARDIADGRPGPIVTGSWEEVAWNGRLAVGTRLGTQLMNFVVTSGGDPQYLIEAGRMLEAAVATGEPLEASVYMNLGIFYFLRREADSDAVQKMVDTWEEYLKLAPLEAPQRALIRELLQDPAGAELNIGAF